MRRGTWIASALGAAAVIILLALSGQRPDPAGLARFEAAGVMLALDPRRVAAVEVRQAEQRWRFQRAPAGGWAAGAVPASEQAGRAVDDGLRFLHGSAPQRVLQPAEVDGIPMTEYGLAPPRYVVTVQDAAGASFTIEFGAVNPQGLAQYARVAGRREVLLLPRFVGRSWETAMSRP
ncbi:MAG: DUF4340 domain-containing protein [Candidatus Rokuibacteriota bacterium]